MQLVPVLVFRNEHDAKGSVAGLLHHRGHQVAAVDGDHVPVADSVGEEGRTGHNERLAGCQAALLARGWDAERYLATGHSPYLVVWPARQDEPLLQRQVLQPRLS